MNLDVMRYALNGTAPAEAPRELLGVVVGGSLAKGLEVRLDGGADLERLAAGSYVSVQGGGSTYFGMITDVELRATTTGVQQSPPRPDDAFVREVLHGVSAYALLHVTPTLRLESGDSAPRPVRTLPPHFAPVYLAAEDEVGRVFGSEDDEHFPIGMPLDMDLDICLSYRRFIERSNGIFGKSGTGKSFLTRHILAHLIERSQAQREQKERSVHLVFDMHNDYGWEASSEGSSGRVKGLKQLGIGGSVVLLTLDEESTRRRKANYDGAVTIGWEDIEPGDLAVLRETLLLTENAVEAAYTLAAKLGQSTWLGRALEMEAEEAAGYGVLSMVLQNLQKGLRRLTREKRFLLEHGAADSLRTILNHLHNGRSIILEFGRYGNDLAAYMLVANVLTRRIHEHYREKVEASFGGSGDDVPYLMITIEEAHKFLSPTVARQTIFGEIAREMRKFKVTLLVIDQRPSMIDDEVLSQIGTKVACLLDNERDIDAVLGGVSGARELRGVLAKLDTRQQALVLGHAVPMPVAVRTAEYGEGSYARFASKSTLDPDDLYG